MKIAPNFNDENIDENYDDCTKADMNLIICVSNSILQKIFGVIFPRN